MEMKNTNTADGVGALIGNTTPTNINEAETSALAKTGIAVEDSHVEFSNGKPSDPETEQAKHPPFAGGGEMEKVRIVKNSDNEFLLPLFGVIGHVYEVNGAGGEEITGFTPTRHELFQLAIYWAQVYLDDMWFCFSYDQSGSSEFRRIRFAQRRLNRLAGIIGDAAVHQAVKEVEDEFKEAVEARPAIDPRIWDKFTSGPWPMEDEEKTNEVQ